MPIPKIYTVGVDALTIQACINLCASPSATNQYVVRIPPGSYVENLTLKGGVNLQGMGNMNDTLTTSITGNHTLTGNAVNPLDNRMTIENCLLVNNSDTLATITMSSTTDQQVNVTGCFLQTNSLLTTSMIFNIGPNVRLYVYSCMLRMNGTANSGGTHFNMTGGQLYCPYDADISGGTKAINMTGANAAQAFLYHSQFNCSNTAEIISIANAGSYVLAGWCSFANSTANGSGANIATANAFMGTVSCGFAIAAGTGYVINGVTGSVFFFANNSYSNTTAAAYNVKIKNLVTALAYTTTLTPSA